MSERSCCDQIVETTARVKSLEEWRDEYVMASQRWRELHAEDNRKSLENINIKLDNISRKLTTYVNPIVVIVISAMAAVIGWLAH